MTSSPAGVDPATSLETRFAIWGTFDVANFGDLLFPRIFEHEIKRRLPQAFVRSFSPLGYLHAVPLDGGFVAEPLGHWSSERIRELAHDVDVVAVGGGEIIHDHDEYYSVWYEIEPEEALRLQPSRFFIEGLGEDVGATPPVAWHSVGIPFDLEGELARRVRDACAHRPYISVRDEHSRSRLVAAGVEREIAVVPDSALLIDRLFSKDLLAQRLEYLRAVGSYPAHGDAPLIVQGSRVLVPFADEIARALVHALANRKHVPILLLEAGPCHGDGEFADILAQFLPPERTYRMREGFVVEDVVAAIASAQGFLGLSLHGSLTAFACDVPFSTMNMVGYSKLSAWVEMAGAEATYITSIDQLGPAVERVLDGQRARGDLKPLRRAIDAHFDRIADLAQRRAQHQLRESSELAVPTVALADSEQRDSLLRVAFEARGRALIRERARLVGLIEQCRRSQSLDEVRLDPEQTRARLTIALAEVERLQQDLRSAESAREAAEDAISLIEQTRLVRYSAPLRHVWSRVRATRS